MAMTIEQLAQKVASLERALKHAGVLADHYEAETDTRLADIQQHLDQQDITQRENNQQVAALAQQVKEGFDEVKRRFDWQDGQIADVKANITEARNTIADLVRHEGEGGQKA